jgi:hypothetical protein
MADIAWNGKLVCPENALPRGCSVISAVDLSRSFSPQEWCLNLNARLLRLACYLRRMADPQKYRDEAARLRRRAEYVLDHDAKRQMLEVAAQYERLADSVALKRKGAVP